MGVTMGKQASVSHAQSGDLVNYTLGVTVTGNAMGNGVVQDVLPSMVTYQALVSAPAGTTASSSGSTLTLTLPASLSPGTYSLIYSVRVNDLVSGGTTAINNAQLSYAGGIPVTSSASFLVTGQYTVEVSVYNEAGELIKTILTEQMSQPLLNFNFGGSNAITTLSGAGSAVTMYYGTTPVGSWDGMTNAGGLASNGGYYIKVDNIDNMGVDKSTTQPVQVARSLYKTTVLIYNEAGEVVKHLYIYTDNPGATGTSSVQFSTQTIEPGSNLGTGSPSQLTITLSDGTKLVWDGTGDSGSYVTSGQYVVEVHTADGQGGQTTFSKSVGVLDGRTTNGVGVITAWPNVLSANSGSMATTFHTDSTMAETLELSVYTLAGELLGTQSGQAGQGTVPFDGTKLASGTYLAVIKVHNANGGVIATQILHIAVIH
jgi:uncharacterized repeat protein (TIGR01451 family)